MMIQQNGIGEGIIFNLESGNGFYIGIPGHDSSQAGNIPFLCFVSEKWDAKMPRTLPIEMTWNQPSYIRGYYLILAGTVTNGDQLAELVRGQNLPSADNYFLWVDNRADTPTFQALPLDRAAGSDETRHTRGAFSLCAGNIAMTIDAGTGVTLDDNLAGFSLGLATEPRGITMRASVGGNEHPLENPVRLPLYGAALCSFRFQMVLLRMGMAEFGGDLRYYTTGSGGGAAREFRYPLFDLRDPQSGGDMAVKFDARFDPYRPADPDRTLFSVLSDLPSPKPFPTFFRTVTGAPVNLIPFALTSSSVTPADPVPPGTAGFAFAVMPAGGAPGYYLAPVGNYTIGFNDGVSGQFGAPVMTGLSGVEFLYLSSLAFLTFIPGRPAFAPPFPLSGSSHGAPLLDGTATTSWVAVDKVQNPGSFGYYAQSGRAVNYGIPLADPEIMAPMQVIVSPPQQSIPPEHAFPMVPYAGLVAPADLQEFALFESQILAPVRQGSVLRNVSGPLFSSRLQRSGRVIDDPGSLLTTLTPQGLLAVLNREDMKFGLRSWSQLVIARDAASNSILAFHGDPAAPGSTVSPKLAQAMSHSDLFMVISRSDNAGMFDAAISMDGFTFDLTLAKQGEKLRAILIFKFVTGIPARELLADISSWVQPGDFNDDPAATQAAILSYVNNDPKNPHLASFNTMMDDPMWRGIVALNCDINPVALPREMKGLLGGMSTPMRGHHLIIAQNQIIQGNTPLTEENLKSSLSGLILYPLPLLGADAVPATAPSANDPADAPPPYDYSVAELDVAFENSVITGYDCVVDLTVNQFFGRAVQRAGGGGNTIRINGTMQRHDGTNIFTFQGADDNIFTTDMGDGFFRAIGRVTITGASFATTSVVDGDDGERIGSTFSLGGGVAFNTLVAPTGTPFDLLGYGDAVDLPFSGLNLDVAFLLTTTGETENRTITLQSSTLRFTSGISPRPGSLPAAMPLTLTGFRADPMGISASSLGGQIVRIPELVGGPREYLTTTPAYALDFTLPLGSLGSLSSLHAGLDAHLVVGWGAGGTVPDDDALCVAIVLPQLTPGFKGFTLQGILQTTFGTCNMVKVAGDRYLLAFNNVALKVFTFTLPPGYIVDLLFLAGRDNPSRNNLAWYVAVQPQDA